MHIPAWHMAAYDVDHTARNSFERLLRLGGMRIGAHLHATYVATSLKMSTDTSRDDGLQNRLRVKLA